MKRIMFKFAAIFLLVYPLSGTAGSSGDLCSLAGSIVRDALVDQTTVQVFGGTEQWREGRFNQLPPLMKNRVQDDIYRGYADMIKFSELTKNQIQIWNNEGLDGSLLAREAIDKVHAPLAELYARNCLRLLFG